MKGKKSSADQAPTQVSVKILDLIARRVSLISILEELAKLIDHKLEEGKCGIYVFDAEREKIVFAIGPGLPESYNNALLGTSLATPHIAPEACVAAERKLIDVEDISQDSRWPLNPWRELASKYGFRRCQVLPIPDSRGIIRASMVVYSHQSLSFPYLDSIFSNMATNLAAIAIEQAHDEFLIKENEERLRLFAIEGAGIGTWNLNSFTGELRLSEECRNLFGIQKQQSITYKMLLAAVHPSDRSVVNTEVNKALKNNGILDIEYRSLWPDGSIHWIAARGRGCDEHEFSSYVMRGVAIDITDRKRTEQLAEENAARFRFLAESLPHKIFTATPEGETDYLNQQWALYTGRMVADVMRLGWREFVHPEDLEKKERNWKYSIENGVPFECEHRFLRADGTYRWHLSRAQPLRQTDGSIAMWIGSNTDVDDLKKAQFQLQEREERFRVMADTTPVLIWMADLAKQCLYFNTRWLEFTGRTLDQEQGEGWLEGVHPDDVKQCQEIYKLGFQQQKAFQMEYRLRRHDGQYRWILDCGQPLRTPDGIFLGYIGGCVDIHEQKELEQRLREAESRARLAIESAGMGFWDWTIGGCIKCSAEHNRILGIDPGQEEATFELLLERVHPLDQSIILAAISRAQNKHMDYEAEYRVFRLNGEMRWILSHGRAFYDENGNARRMIGVIRDVTERKASEDQIRSNQEELKAALASAELAREQAETASQAKDKFLAVLSHELRTPLTPVFMAISTIRAEKQLSENANSALDMIHRNVKLEADLIADLLDLTRITRNKVNLDLECIDLHLAIRQAIEVCEAEIVGKSLLFATHLDAHSHYIAGDLSKLQQVFWNLIKNAVKFTPALGSITIRSYDLEGRVRVEVQDSGIGIKREVLPYIFLPFEQGDNNVSRQLGGLGLGLAISKVIVEAHSGQLLAHSEGEGQGALFSIELATINA